MPIQRERETHTMVTDYLRLNYPHVLYRSDFAAGEKMTPSQAVRNKRVQKCRAWPDITIYEARGAWNGLCLELKADGTRVWLANGQLATNGHLREQWEVLKGLELRGYKAVFAVGFDAARNEIDNYMRLPKLHA